MEHLNVTPSIFFQTGDFYPMHPDEQNLLAAVENADLKTVVTLAASSNINKQTLTDDLLNPVLCLALKKIDEARPTTINIAEKLITKGYPVDVADDDGNTPLHIAVQTRQVNLIAALIKKGADLHAENENGETPIDVAVECDVDLVGIYKKHQENVKKAEKSKENLQPSQADTSSAVDVLPTAEKTLSALPTASVPNPTFYQPEVLELSSTVSTQLQPPKLEPNKKPFDEQGEPESIRSERNNNQNDSSDESSLLEGDNPLLEAIQRGKEFLDKQQYIEAVYYFRDLGLVRK